MQAGINAVFRIMAQNQNNPERHGRFQNNILISINSIIWVSWSPPCSAVLGKHPTCLFRHTPRICLCGGYCIAILATRPNTNHGKFTEDDIRINGPTCSSSATSSGWTCTIMTGPCRRCCPTKIISTAACGITISSVVLAKKYRFLRIAYNIFMWDWSSASLPSPSPLLRLRCKRRIK